MTGRPTEESGAVLVVVVLLALALLGLAHGLLVSAELAHTTAAAHREVVELDALARERLREEMLGGWAPWMDSVAVGGSRTSPVVLVGSAATRGRWRRLGPEAWLLGAAASRGSRAPVALRRLVWLLDPDARVTALPGVVAVGAGAPVTIQGAVLADVAPAVAVGPEAALGRLGLRRLLEEGDSLGPVGTPTPSEIAGSCDRSTPWNWGDPSRPWRPCGAHRVLAGRSGDLIVAGGEGQGVLAVDGDVTLGLGARFHGVLVTSGRLVITDGAEVEGRVLALGGLYVDASSRIVGSAAVAREALTAIRDRVGPALLLHGAPRMGPG